MSIEKIKENVKIVVEALHDPGQERHPRRETNDAIAYLVEQFLCDIHTIAQAQGVKASPPTATGGMDLRGRS